MFVIITVESTTHLLNSSGEMGEATNITILLTFTLTRANGEDHRLKRSNDVEIART